MVKFPLLYEFIDPCISRTNSEIVKYKISVNLSLGNFPFTHLPSEHFLANLVPRIWHIIVPTLLSIYTPKLVLWRSQIGAKLNNNCTHFDSDFWSKFRPNWVAENPPSMKRQSKTASFEPQSSACDPCLLSLSHCDITIKCGFYKTSFKQSWT